MLATTTPFLLKTADNPDGVDRRLLDRFRVAWSRDFPKWLADNVRPFFSPETSPETIQGGVQMCLQASLKAVIDCNRAITETDFRAELRNLAVTTMIIHGDADASAPLLLTGQKSAQLIRGSQLKIYEGAPHGLFITHQDRPNRDLVDFINAD
jgi:pimeloyl-ACP methyl ester carboxylesterase